MVRLRLQNLLKQACFIFDIDLVGFTRWTIALDPLLLTTLAGRETACKTKHVRAVIFRTLEAQRAGIRSAADVLVPRPMLALALSRTVPSDYFTLAARAMELGLLLAHRARLGAALLLAALAALLHWCFFSVCSITSTACGVQQLLVAATTMREGVWGCPITNTGPNWRAGRCLLVPLSR